MIIAIFLTLTYLLNIIDYNQTCLIVHKFGLLAELNPFVRFMITHNTWGIFKLVIVPILLFILGFFIVRLIQGKGYLIYLLFIYFLWVVLHNLFLFI